MMPPSNPWVEKTKRKMPAECRLFCLPYAGGSSAIYMPWVKTMPPFIEVVPIQLAGRGARMRETPCCDLMKIVEDLTPALVPMLREMPFAFFGHSMGAIISFETTRKLAAEHGLRPFVLFVSGRQAPHLLDRDKPIHDLPEPEFVAELKRLKGTPEQVLASKELMDLLTPVLRADFEAISNYRYSGGRPVDVPLVALGGEHDEDVLPEDVAAWRDYTSAEFNLKMYDGDHFFLHPKQNELLADVVQEIRRRRMLTAAAHS